MKFQILDKNSIPGYLDKVSGISEFLGNNRVLEIDEVGDGNLNFVFKIKNINNPEKQIILKQAVPYLRMAGEDWPLNKNRMMFEIRALKLDFNIVPKFTPKVYYADEEMSIVIMQYLSNHISLRYGMIDQIIYPRLSEHIATYLAETLFKTSSLYLSSEEKRKLMSQFTLNTDLCELSENFIFSFPFMEHESNYKNSRLNEFARDLRNDSNYKINILNLKNIFMNKTDALLHGDIHTGSLMVNQSETYAIDPEFAFFGPFGFDIGKLMGNFLLSYISHYYHSSNGEYQDWVLKGFFEIWDKFSEKFLNLWDQQQKSALLLKGFLTKSEFVLYKKQFMESLLSETVGFAGCCIARRTIGIAGVIDIRGIEDITIRTELELTSLKLSQLLINNYQNVNTSEYLKKLVTSFFNSLSFNFRKH